VLVVPFKAEFKLPEKLFQDSHSVKRKGYRSQEMTKSKESSGNKPNELLAEEPAAVTRSSCSGSAFRNCHSKEKMGCLS